MRALKARPLRLAVAVLLLGGASLYVAPAAQAAVTRVVDDDGKATVANCGAATPAPSNINTAIAASSPGDTIKVCPGTYTGPVNIDRQLTVNGPQVGVSATVRSFNAATEAVISTNGTSDDAVNISAAKVTFDGFTVQASKVGISAVADGGGFNVRNNLVRGNVNGMQIETLGTYPSVVNRNRLSWNNAGGGFLLEERWGIVSLSALNNITFRDNGFMGQKLGGFLSSNCGSGYNSGLTFIDNNFTNNAGGIDLLDNQTDIKIFGTKFDDELHTVSIPGILIAEDVTNVTIGAPGKGNKIKHASIGIEIADTTGFCSAPVPGFPEGPITVQNNTVTGSELQGIFIDYTPVGRVHVLNNTVTDSADSGISVNNGSAGNTIDGNTVSGSVSYDCTDGSTGGAAGPPNFGTQNSWTNNVGSSSLPAGLCDS